MSLLPSRTDMTILGEVARLAETHYVVLVSEDKDYTSFQNEILEEFHVKTLPLQDIPGTKEDINKLLDQLCKNAERAYGDM